MNSCNSNFLEAIFVVGVDFLYILQFKDFGLVGTRGKGWFMTAFPMGRHYFMEVKLIRFIYKTVGRFYTLLFHFTQIKFFVSLIMNGD
jgi:hypothetical protein